MKHVKVLDCTLRDGGYVVDSIFGDNVICGIIEKLCKSKIDIIEVGFLKDIEHKNGSSTYSNLNQLKKYLPKERNQTSFAVMIDYGRYTIENLPKYDGETIDSIRNCFFKKDRFQAKKSSEFIKAQGYKLFVQPVDILGYNDKELLELIEDVNTIKPYAFPIVDTFGSMYEEDLIRVFSLLDHNLDKSIKIGFHSHNNLQLSFALSQKLMQISQDKRDIIIDATLYGMGRGAGNTNTELLLDYLNRKQDYMYDINELLDLIDIYISPIAKEKHWGYSIPYFIAGMYSTHVHNITYLLDKHKVSSKDMQIIISSLDETVKKRYDYDNLENVYIEYFNNEIDDEKSIIKLKECLDGRDILILAPGSNLEKYKNKIEEFCGQNKNLIAIAINIYNNLADILFFSNPMRYNYALSKYPDLIGKKKKIVTSNIRVEADENMYMVNYNNLLIRKYAHFDNSMMLFLNLLQKLNARNIYFAGFDGYTSKNNYYDKSLQTYMSSEDRNELNMEIEDMLLNLKNNNQKFYFEFITPSLYEDVSAQKSLLNFSKH